MARAAARVYQRGETVFEQDAASGAFFTIASACVSSASLTTPRAQSSGGRAPSAMHRALTPSSAIPLVYFGLAHLLLAGGLAVLVATPDLPGGFFYHPKMIALVHVVTLGWITSSMLGSFYVVAPLALGLPMPVSWRDWTGFSAFAIGTIGMVAHFWIGTYDGMAWSAGMVVLAALYPGARAIGGLRLSTAPRAIAIHVGLAFANFAAAGAFGILIGLDRSRGFLGLSPIAATYAHAHLAAIGWVLMMVMGLSYRLVPMLLPAAMPSGRSLYASAVLAETGLLLLALALITGSPMVLPAAVLIVTGIATFAIQIARTGLRRLPRPPALPAVDWSVRHIHLAFLWLLSACVLGFVLARDGAAARPGVAWVYGTAALVGCFAQLIVGMQARLVPFQIWYRAMAAGEGQPPGFSAHGLPSAGFARATFIAWSAGVPLLAWGLASQRLSLIRGASVLLLAGLTLHGSHLTYMLVRARVSHANRSVRRTDGSRATHGARQNARPHGGRA